MVPEIIASRVLPATMSFHSVCPLPKSTRSASGTAGDSPAEESSKTRGTVHSISSTANREIILFAIPTAPVL